MSADQRKHRFTTVWCCLLNCVKNYFTSSCKRHICGFQLQLTRHWHLTRPNCQRRREATGTGETPLIDASAKQTISLPHSLYLKFIEHLQSNSKLVVWTNTRSTARRACVARPPKLCDFLHRVTNCNNQPHIALFVCHLLNKIMKLIIAVCLNRDI